MAISFVGVTAPTAEGSAINTPIAVPAGVQDGDTLIASVFLQRLDDVTAPAGWTLAGSLAATGATGSRHARLAVFTRTAIVAEPASYTFTHPGGIRQGGMVAYRGATVVAANGAFQDVGGTSANPSGHTATLTLPSPVSGGVAVNVAACGYDPTAPAWNPTGTQRWDFRRFTFDENAGVTAAAGAYTPPALTHDGASHAWVGVTVMLAPTAPASPDLVLNAVAPAAIGSLALDHTPPPVDLSLAGMAPTASAGFTFDVPGAPADLALNGFASQATASFTLDAPLPVDLSLAGSASAAVGSFAIESIGGAVGTDATNAAAFVQISGRGYVESNPPVVPVPPTRKRGSDYVKAFAYTMPAMVDGRPEPIAPDEVAVKAHRDRIIVGGKDVTFFRDVKTPTPGFKLIQPLGYDSTTLVFPQTHAIFEQPGKGALSWLDKEKRVEIHRVDSNGNVVGVDYRGVITAMRASGRMWVADVGGEVTGRAALRERQVPLFRWVRDTGIHMHAVMVALGLRFTPRFGPETGIDLPGLGGMRMLDWVNHLCAMSVKKNGDQYALMPSEAHPRVWEFRVKDTSTRHCTIYLDAARMVPELVDDLAEQPNRIFGTGVTPDGMVVKNGRYPGLKQATAPDYPFADNRTFGFGTSDSTPGITVGSIHALNWRLIGHGLLDREDINDDYTEKTANAVEELQDRAELPITGDIDPATWDALFDNNVLGFDIRQSRIEPMAQRAYVKPWRYSASGAKIARNPNYDPTRLPVERTIDFGAGHTKQQMVEWSRREMNRGTGKNWVGTIKVETGAVVRGNHTPGEALTTADVMPLRELRPGMNAWLPLFDGGTLVHIVGIDVDAGGRTGTLTVDTKYRDLLAVSEIIERNRESRRDPARAFLNQHRSSKAMKDALITFDEVGGLVFDKIVMPAFEWTEFPVVAGQEGTIRRLETLLQNSPSEYVLTVWGKKPGERNLAAKFPNPFPLDDDGDPVWAQEGVQAYLKDKVFLYAAGDEEQPLGFWPRKHTNAAGDITAHPVTGKWVDDAQFSYHTFAQPVLWVAIYPKRATELNRGRIMWPQLEAGS